MTEFFTPPSEADATRAVAHVQQELSHHALVAPEDWLRPNALQSSGCPHQTIRAKLAESAPDPKKDEGRALRVHQQQQHAAWAQFAAYIVNEEPHLARTPWEAQNHADMGRRLRLAGVDEATIRARWD
jgi:hypothetical protein